MRDSCEVSREGHARHAMETNVQTTSEESKRAVEGSNSEAAHETVRWFKGHAPPDLWAQYTAFLQGRITALLDPKAGLGRGRKRDGYVRLQKTALEGRVATVVTPVPVPVAAAPMVEPSVQEFDFSDVVAEHAEIEREERRLREHILGMLAEREPLRDTTELMDRHSFQVWTSMNPTRGLAMGDPTTSKIGLVGTWDIEINGVVHRWRCKVNGVNLGVSHPACHRGSDGKAMVESIGRGTPQTFYIWGIRLKENTLISWDLHDGKRNTRFMYAVWKSSVPEHGLEGEFLPLSEAAYKKRAFDLGISLS